jgi:hypothetical protein
MDEDVAKRVYIAESAEDKVTHQLLVSLLNHLEFVAIAYHRRAVRQSIILDALRGPPIRYYIGLEPFIRQYNEFSGGDRIHTKPHDGSHKGILRQ